jgi:uncharacterized membrane protein
MKNILAENMIRFGTKNLHVDAFLLQENISTDMLNTIKKAPSLKKLGMIDATAGTEIAYGSTKAPLTIFIDPSKHKDDDVYWDIKTALNKLMLGTQFNVITGPMVIIGYGIQKLGQFIMHQILNQVHLLIKINRNIIIKD